jgi:hypothetical protein
MQNTHCKDARKVRGTLLAAAGFLIASPMSASALTRLSADFQDTASGANEVSTTAPALPGGAGGTVVYTKTVLNPIPGTLFISFSAQGDSHQQSALLMNARVNGALCQPLAGQTGGGGGGAFVQTGWYTLLHPPLGAAAGTCNNGGGGFSDCHDNAISFTCCVQVRTSFSTVQIRLANLPGGGANRSFYERATIYIDGEAGTRLCLPHAPGADVTSPNEQ